MTVEITLEELRQWAKLSHGSNVFENFIKMHYFKLSTSAKTPEIKVMLIIDEQEEKK